MNNKDAYKKVFDSIHASDKLKQETLEKARVEMEYLTGDEEVRRLAFLREKASTANGRSRSIL